MYKCKKKVYEFIVQEFKIFMDRIEFNRKKSESTIYAM